MMLSGAASISTLNKLHLLSRCDKEIEMKIVEGNIEKTQVLALLHT